MSLARTLLNGGSVGMGDVVIESARYGHAEGASIIAMESIEELHEIFMESYNYEQAEIAAATEGVALEGSQFEAVAEAAISNGIAKVKEFLQKLWKKVKEFFHNVKRFLDSIFLSGKEFVKRYEKDIDAIKNLDDFSYTMYKYNNDEIENEAAKKDVAADAKELIDKAKALAEKLSKVGDVNTFEAEMDQKIKEIKAAIENDTIVKTMTDSKCSSADDYDEYVFKLFRSGADTKEDRELRVSDIIEFTDTLKASKAMSVIDKQQKSSDDMFKKALDGIKDLEKKQLDVVKDEKNSAVLKSKILEISRLISTGVSRFQTQTNKRLTAWKNVVKERDAAYKSAIMAALSYDKKASKKK